MPQTPKSALCVVGLGFEPHWISILQNGQEETWLKSVRPENINILHVHGRPLNRVAKYFDDLHESLRWKSRVTLALISLVDLALFFPLIIWIPKISISRRISLKDPVFEVSIPDFYPLVRWKELSYFQYFLEHSQADFLITTTNSSYLNLKVISEFLQNLEPSEVYLGPSPFKEAKFVSGSFRIFSRDVIKEIVVNRTRWNLWDLEDVAIGKLIDSLGVKSSFFPANNLDSIEKIEGLTQTYLKSQMHFRLKSGTMKDRQDVPLMKFLHARIGNVS